MEATTTRKVLLSATVAAIRAAGIRVWQRPGSAGKSLADYRIYGEGGYYVLAREMAGDVSILIPVRGEGVSMCTPLCSKLRDICARMTPEMTAADFVPRQTHHVSASSCGPAFGGKVRGCADCSRLGRMCAQCAHDA